MKKLKLISIITPLFVLSILLTMTSHQAKGVDQWKAGVSKTIITPKQPMWMAGYAGRTAPSEGTLHDLWAKALVLEDGNDQRAVLLSFDLSGMPKSMSDRVRDQLKEKFQLSRDQILMNFSHTHSGPVLRDYLYHIYPLDAGEVEKIENYSDQLELIIIALVEEALNSLEPVQLYAGTGVSRFQVNRRNNSEATLASRNDLSGPNDYAVPVIKVVGRSGEVKAIAFGYACHPTVLSENKWSGDYAGYTQSELESAFPGATALFFQGAGGDQNPLPRRTVTLAKQYGKELAAAVERVLHEEMTPLVSNLTLSYSEIDLPLNELLSKEDLSKMVNETTGHYRAWARMFFDRVDQGESIEDSYPYPIQAWKLGDQLIISLGGEPVIDYAIQIKKKYGPGTFVFGYSNDVMAYIPSARVLAEGGYEGATSQMAVGLPATWKPATEGIILKEIDRLVKEIDQAR